MTAIQPQDIGDASFQLYTNYRSSSSARLRIALALKKLPTKSNYIDMMANDIQKASYALLNPNQTVPTLITTKGNHKFTVHQSVAALEYLDEAFPSTYQLLPPPSETELRATVRTLVGIIASDIQAPTSLRTLKRVRKLAASSGEDPEQTAKNWATEVITAGFLAYEAVSKDFAGKYSVGDSVTMADCCLAPAIWAAEGFGVDIGHFPTISRVHEELSKREEIVCSHWKNQEDTPKELRG